MVAWPKQRKGQLTAAWACSTPASRGTSTELTGGRKQQRSTKKTDIRLKSKREETVGKRS